MKTATTKTARLFILLTLLLSGTTTCGKCTLVVSVHANKGKEQMSQPTSCVRAGRPHTRIIQPTKKKKPARDTHTPPNQPSPPLLACCWLATQPACWSAGWLADQQGGQRAGRGWLAGRPAGGCSHIYIYIKPLHKLKSNTPLRCFLEITFDHRSFRESFV